jgi:ABC-2 type transport system permease protein
MNGQLAAILWAQWRSLLNLYPKRDRAGMLFTAVITFFWYGIWVVAASGVALLVSESRDNAALERFLAPGLMMSFFYWQVIPVLMVSAGASIELRKIRVYPIPHRSLFGMEVALRITTAIEMVLMIMGATLGLMLHPALPLWHALAFVPYLLFNLFVSAGIRDLITRLLAWRRFREVFLFLLVILAALPQVLLRGDPTMGGGARWLPKLPILLPWTATARLLTGHWNWAPVVALLGWTVGAYAFGRWMFERSLRFDEEAARATPVTDPAKISWTERLFALPGRIFADPLACMVEKELRSLVRSPRFRIVFLMGFSFGLMIWLPVAFGERRGVMAEHFLVIVSGYAVMLLSEVTIWNVFGFDRSAAQMYWVTPVSATAAVVAKNTSAAIFVFLEIAIISCVCLLFRLPVTPHMVLDTVLVIGVLLLFLMGVGNWSSLRFARPVDPDQNWKRGATSRFQALLLILYPLISLPFVFAFFARSVWEAEWPFYAVLTAVAAVAACVYWGSLEWVEQEARRHRERILSLLAGGGDPILS